MYVRTVEPPNKGHATLSSVERLSFSLRLKMCYCYGKEVKKIFFCREVVEGPL